MFIRTLLFIIVYYYLILSVFKIIHPIIITK